MALLIALLSLCTIHYSPFPSPALAQSPTLTDAGVTNDFPNGLTFAVTAESDSPIEELRLVYKVLPDGALTRAVPDFEPGTSIETTFLLEGNTNIYLPPGVEVEYHWEATDADGATAETETETYFYDDVRFDWQSVEGGGVTIYYYSGSSDDAQRMHDTAQEHLERMNALLGTEVPFTVLVWTYADTDDMRPALQRRSPTFDSQIITAGVRVASNIVLVLGNASFDTLRHELTHVVTKQAGESALGTLPSWLDEGTAVYSQSDPGGFGDAIERALNSGDVLSVREISAYPGDPDKVTLFYGEGYSLVSFLIDEFGEAQFAELFATVKSGNRIGSALEEVYGFNEDGLENAWREANGLPPRDTPEPTTQPQQPGDITDTGDGGTSTGTVIVIAAGILALAAVVGVGGILLARRL
jgi:hypothetical protein